MSQDRLKWSTIVAYVLPGIPMSALGLPLAVFVAPYYATKVGISATMVGLIFLAVRLLDIFFDPLFGFYSDHNKTRWGRRRHWLVVTSPILMVVAYFLFNPPVGASSIYLAGWLTVVYLGYSVVTITHASWGAELSAHYHERSRVQGAREFALVGGMLFVLMLPALLEQFFDADATEKVSAMGWFIILLLPITVGIAVMFVGESNAPVQKDVDWRGAWRLLRTNPAMKRVMFADLLLGLAVSITASLYIFLVDHVFSLPNMSSTLLLVYFLTGLLGIPLWMRLSYKFGKHRTLAGAALYAVLLLPVNFLVPQDGSAIWAAFAVTALYGIAYGAGPFLLRAIMADVADEETAQTGQERAGVYFSFLILTNKLGYALSIGITYPLLDLVGFNGAPGADNPENAITGILLIYVLLPSALLLLTAWVLWNFPLDETKQAGLRAIIAARKKKTAEESLDPVAAATVVGSGLDEVPDDLARGLLKS